MTDDSSRHVRYAAVVIIVLVFGALLLPAVNVLDALGYFGEKTYLFVLQDNSELRNTGGFLACVGTIDVQNGELKNINLLYTGNVNNSPRYGMVEVDSPQSWFTVLYNTTLMPFRDMNVQYDFATFAPLFSATYKEITGQQVDGVIAIDLTALQQLLKTAGPITVENGTVTWRNVIDRVHFISANAKEAGKPDLTTFLTELGKRLIATVQTAGPVEKLLMLSNLQTLAQQRHLLIYAPDTLKGYDGAIQNKAGDYLYVVDSNVYAAKADLNVNRTLTYHTRIEDNGTQTSNLTITYTNNCWWNYTVFTTALVPKDAQVLDARYNSSDSIGPVVTPSGDLTAISSWVDVAPYSTANVTYTYTFPSTVEAGAASHYNLYVQKQAGIDHYTLNTDVTLPHGAHLIHESNVGNGIVSNGDVQVEVIYR
jgi:hypothetical protein